MDITIEQIKGLRTLLSKEDRATIALQTKFSIRTVESVLQGTRRNDEIEKLIVLHTYSNLVELEKIITDVRSKNRVEHISHKGYEDAINSEGWQRGADYLTHIDVYLQLTHIKFNSIEDLWVKILEQYKFLIHLDYYCIEVLRRIMGVSSIEAVSFYTGKMN